MSSGRLQHRIDPKLQESVEAIFLQLGLKPAQAITLFYREVERVGTLPFHPSSVYSDNVPNAQLQKDIEEARRGEGIMEFDNWEDMKAHLDSLKNDEEI